MTKVYLVKLLATGQPSYSFICASHDVAVREIRKMGITEICEAFDGVYSFTNPRDRSQTAVILERPVVQ